MYEAIVGRHPSLAEVLRIASEVAKTDAIVIISGESGTGKELLAHSIHCNSLRNEKPFIPLNCAALPQDLLETELFGHVRGAFTGAITTRLGWLEVADGGTIFLDEIGDMSLALQARLLRVLETGEYTKVGGNEIKYCNVRFIAASNKNLQDLVDAGRFRDDLFFRLNVIDLFIPPLRERRTDIALLIDHFLNFFRNEYLKPGLKISPEVMQVLSNYSYPGNIRELRNILNKMVILAKSEYLIKEDLPKKLLMQIQNGPSLSVRDFHTAKQYAIECFEKQYIVSCLEASKGNVAAAARTAGLHVTNMHEKIKKYEIKVFSFKSEGSALGLTNM